MKCPVCSEVAPFQIEEEPERRGYEGKSMWFAYTEELGERRTRVISGVEAVPLVFLFTDPKSGTIFNAHYCHDREGWSWTITGLDIPADKTELSKFFSFCKDALCVEETRGRKGQISMQDIDECIRRMRRTDTQQSAATRLGVSVRRIQQICEDNGTTFTKRREEIGSEKARSKLSGLREAQ